MNIRLLTFVSLVLFGLFFPTNATLSQHTQGIAVHAVKQVDLDSDGKLDVTVIDCSFVTAHDQVMVYYGDNKLRNGSDWKRLTNFENDTWIFDANADSTVQLIIRFAEENNRSVAFVYTDQDGDGQVAYQANGKDVKIRETPHWSMKVESDKNWFLPDGVPNLNLTFLIDGNFVPESVTMPRDFLDLLKTDGQLDFEFDFVDNNHDGILDYGHRILLAPSYSEMNYQRNLMFVNKGHKQPVADGFIFWPFLGGASWYKIKGVFDSVPTIDVDWSKAVISKFGLIGDFIIEDGYTINNFQEWERGEINYADFENPMAYYDLAGDHDGWPEMHIRLEYFDPLDRYLDIGKVPVPISDIRYSWNQSNRPGLSWDYKIGLAGTNPVSSSVSFDGFGVQTVPYELLPKWVSDNTWTWGTLVVNEGTTYQSSEGIYEWAALHEVYTDTLQGGQGAIKGTQYDLRYYLTGQTNESVDRFYRKIRTGLRGEFGYLKDRPNLYFSPIDGRLHLRKALHGVWNIGNGTEIRYINSDGDAYLDEWQFYDQSKLRLQLMANADHLLYSDGNNVVIKQTRIAPALFQTLPPRNRNEWLELSKKIETYKHNFEPADFEAMLTQFDGATMRVTGATLRDYRVTKQGFRFVIDLKPGFQVTGEELADVAKLPPGSYVISYDGSFNVQPLTPAALKISIADDAQELELPTAYRPHDLLFSLRNDGLEDAETVVVSSTMSLAGQPLTASSSLTTTVLAGATVPIRLPWTPAREGAWQIRTQAFLLGQDDTIVNTATTDQTIVVQPAASTSPQEETGAFGVVPQGATVLLLGSLAALGGLAAWVFGHGLFHERDG